MQSFTASAAGQVETWQKWSFDLQSSPLTLLQQPESRWIGVQKTRQIKAYGLSTEQTLLPLEPDAEVLCGCKVEIAQIDGLDQSWYSLGLEAVGSHPDREIALRQGAIALLSSVNFSSLTPINSHSYPSWLAQLGDA
jgi:hypothetical protein